MTDLSKTILAKSDQLNADDLAGPITVQITDVREASSPDQPIIIKYEGDNGKPFKPCKTVRRLLVRAWGANGREYIGRYMTLYNDPTVKWGGEAVGGIRVSHLSHIDTDLTVPLTVTRGNKRPFTVKRLDALDAAPEPPDPMAVVDAITKATNAAQGGTNAFREWYKSDEGKNVRHLFKDDAAEMEKIKAECTRADQEILAGTADDVFGEDNSGGTADG